MRKDLKEIKALVESGVFPRWDTVTGFSEFMCETHFPAMRPGREELIRELERLKRRQNRIIPDTKESTLIWSQLEDEIYDINLELSIPKNKFMRDIVEDMNWTKKTLKDFFKIVAPDGLIAGRGLHGMAFPTVEYIWELLYASEELKKREKDPYNQAENFSLNLAASAQLFALPRTHLWSSYTSMKWLKGAPERAKRRQEIDPFYGVEDDFNTHLIESAKDMDLKPTKKNLLEINRASQCGVFIVARIPNKYLIGFGEDGESHFGHEAEIKVKPCLDDCITDIFVLSPKKMPGYGPVTEEERRRFCLSYYNIIVYEPYSNEHMTLMNNNPLWLQIHADVKCNVPNNEIVKIRTPYEAAIHNKSRRRRQREYRPDKLSAGEERQFKSLKWYRLW